MYMCIYIYIYIYRGKKPSTYTVRRIVYVVQCPSDSARIWKL